MSQPNTYTIFCVVKGDCSPFPVKIAEDETIYGLKEAIKQEKRIFFNTDLTLYLVDIPDDKELEANVRKELLKDPEPLRATVPLAKIFGGVPKKETINIIVQPSETGESYKNS